jgi:dTMP kinase
MKKRGKFLVLEGGLGSGKTTKINLLREELDDWEFYREPGGTSFGEAIREILIEEVKDARQRRGGNEINPYASLFAFSSTRANLVREVIIPKLEEGRNVALDRYWYSTWAYQGAEGIPKFLIWILSLVATKGLKPDLVLHYDLLPEEGKRQKKGLIDTDRYDLADLKYHEKVRRNYMQLKKFYPKIWRTIDASRPVEEVFEDSLKTLREYKLI